MGSEPVRVGESCHSLVSAILLSRGEANQKVNTAWVSATINITFTDHQQSFLIERDMVNMTLVVDYDDAPGGNNIHQGQNLNPRESGNSLNNVDQGIQEVEPPPPINMQVESTPLSNAHQAPDDFLENAEPTATGGCSDTVVNMQSVEDQTTPIGMEESSTTGGISTAADEERPTCSKTLLTQNMHTDQEDQVPDPRRPLEINADFEPLDLSFKNTAFPTVPGASLKDAGDELISTGQAETPNEHLEPLNLSLKDINHVLPIAPYHMTGVPEGPFPAQDNLNIPSVEGDRTSTHMHNSSGRNGPVGKLSEADQERPHCSKASQTETPSGWEENRRNDAYTQANDPPPNSTINGNDGQKPTGSKHHLLVQELKKRTLRVSIERNIAGPQINGRSTACSTGLAPVKRFRCETCGKPSNCKQASRQHKYRHMNWSDFETTLRFHVKCHLCPADRASKTIFTRPSDLEKHLRCHRDPKSKYFQSHFPSIFKPRRPFKCPHCPREYKNKRTLVAHVKTHATNWPLTCYFCRKACRSKSTLEEHLLVHTEERHYPCPHCCKRYSANRGLKKHVRSLHNV